MPLDSLLCMDGCHLGQLFGLVNLNSGMVGPVRAHDWYQFVFLEEQAVLLDTTSPLVPKHGGESLNFSWFKLVQELKVVLKSDIIIFF